MPVGAIAELVRGDVFYWGQLMAAALLGSIPVAIIYSFFVEHYVAGLTSGCGQGLTTCNHARDRLGHLEKPPLGVVTAQVVHAGPGESVIIRRGVCLPELPLIPSAKRAFVSPF